MRSRLRFAVWALAYAMSVGGSSLANAANAADAAVAVVNGIAIELTLLERNVQANVAQGQKDTPELRAILKQELVARELMAQEAQKRGLDTLSTTKDALQLMRQNLLIELVLNDEFAKKPITDAELKAEYERQVKTLRASGDLQEFQVSSIVLASEADARAVMLSLGSGQAFDALAKSKSIDPSKERGGDLGWFLANQITPAIANVIANLVAGAVSAVPIQVGPYWHVVKLTAKRPYQMPSFEESKSVLQAAVGQERRSGLLKMLIDAAVVK